MGGMPVGDMASDPSMEGMPMGGQPPLHGEHARGSHLGEVGPAHRPGGPGSGCHGRRRSPVKRGRRRGTRLAEVGGRLLVGLVGGHRVALRGLQSEQGRATAGREGRRRVLGDGGQGGATARDEEGATRATRKGATGFSPFYSGFD